MRVRRVKSAQDSRLMEFWDSPIDFFTHFADKKGYFSRLFRNWTLKDSASLFHQLFANGQIKSFLLSTKHRVVYQV
jgi:hypothetical protein